MTRSHMPGAAQFGKLRVLLKTFEGFEAEPLRTRGREYFLRGSDSANDPESPENKPCQGWSASHKRSPSSPPGLLPSTALFLGSSVASWLAAVTGPFLLRLKL